jgi:hypothetical protein
MACANGGITRDCWNYRTDKADWKYTQEHGGTNE